MTEERTYECRICGHAYTIGYMSLDLSVCAGCRSDAKRAAMQRAMQPTLDRDREERQRHKDGR